jgi:hypothetical protein
MKHRESSRIWYHSKFIPDNCTDDITGISLQMGSNIVSVESHQLKD